jgi:hypothetical protein
VTREQRIQNATTELLAALRMALETHALVWKMRPKRVDLLARERLESAIDVAEQEVES